MTAIRNFTKVFDHYVNHPNIKGSFAQIFYQNYKIFDDKNKNYPSVCPQTLLLKFTVPLQVCNFNKNVHGGAFATIIDSATTLAILKYEKHLRKNVTISINQNCLAAANVDDDLIILSQCTRLGKNIAFTDCSIYLEKNQKLLVTGSHTKIFLNDTWDEEIVKISQQ